MSVGSWKKQRIAPVADNTFQGDLARGVGGGGGGDRWSIGGGGAGENAVDPTKERCETIRGGDTLKLTYCSVGVSPVGETVTNLFDGGPHTKWLAFWNFETTRELPKHPGKAPYVTFAACSRVNRTAPCEETAFRSKWYSVTSAPDGHRRDPVHWTLEGTLNGRNWTTIDTQDNVTWRARTETQRFEVARPGLFVRYKMTVLAIEDPYEADCVQLGDLWLGGRPEPPPEPPVCETTGAGYVCMCCGKVPSAEGLDKLFDGTRDTKLLLQPKHVNDYGYNITIAKDALATVDFPVAAYSIAAANDFPARDPAAWRLSARGASTGNKWVVLDEQSGVVFKERFERRLFRIGHGRGRAGGADAPSSGYGNHSEYMLTILAVANPREVKCSAPKCLQFSELALHEPGHVPTPAPPSTTTATTTTTTTEPAWDVVGRVDGWPGGATRTQWDIKVTVGGVVQWNLSTSANIISGTRDDPTDMFGFIVNQCARPRRTPLRRYCADTVPRWLWPCDAQGPL